MTSLSLTYLQNLWAVLVAVDCYPQVKLLRARQNSCPTWWKRGNGMCLGGGTVSSDIKNVVTYLMRQYAFQSRHYLMRVFQLCCLFIESHDVAPAFVDFHFSECVIRPGLLTSCLRSVQSFVSSSSYDQSSFFSSTAVDRVRQSLGHADAFMKKTDFNPWEGVCTGDFVNLFRRLDDAYTSYLQERVKSAESHYKTANISNRQVLVASPIVKFGATQSSVGTSSVVSTKSVGKPQASKDDGGAFVKSVFGCGGSPSKHVVTSSQRGRGRAGPKGGSKTQGSFESSK